MPGIQSLTEVLVTELRDLYDAEKRLTKAIPRMAKKAANPALRTALNDHLKETNGQVRRLEQAFRHLGEKPRGKACAGMRGIVEEGDEHVGEDYDSEALRDAVIIGSAMRVEHYEMAAYMGAIEHARTLGHREVRNLLEETLAEEQAADKKLRTIGQTVNPAAAASDGAGGLTSLIARTLSGGGNGSASRGTRRSSGGRGRSRKSAKKR
ncbi:MAG TPA: ferritin-like domain-containing protein [Vicinamibacterales bacterium]|nr:ferritin-like domain-containing protein [Vicinamibacterales bacterium]